MGVIAVGRSESKQQTGLPAALGRPPLSDAVMDAAPDAILVVNTGGTIVFVNGAAEQLFGYSRDEPLGSPLTGSCPNASGASMYCTVLSTPPRRGPDQWAQASS